MEIRLKKIGKVKATQFNKDFDGVYDYWKKRAEQDYKYYDDLKFIKEHGQVFIYIKMNPLEENELINPDDYSDL
jgi:hypothetical protein